MTSTTMGEPVTQGQFFERMKQSDEATTDQHRRVRESIDALRDDIFARMDAHAAEDRAVADRVLRIETQREMEAKAAIKHGAWAGILAAAGLTGLVEVGKTLFGK